MFGAILGDMIGAPYEFDRGSKTKDFPMFTDGSQYTDDTVMTIAVAEALMDTLGKSDEDVKTALVCSMQKWGKRYPNAGYGTPAVNAQAASVQGYMVQLAEPMLVARQLQRIDHITASIALQKIMGTVGDAFTTLGKVELTTAESVLPQLNELERNLVTPELLEAVGEPLLARVWRDYMHWKQDNSYASDLQTLEAAQVPEHVSYALLSNLQLSQVEQRFIQKIPAGCLTIIHVQTPKGDPVPRNAINQSPEPCAFDAPVPDCVDCQDIGTEIRWALQHLIEDNIPAEDAVIVCPDDAYGLRVEEEGKLIGITVDSAFGMPATMTKTALLIRCILDWAGKNYDVEALRPALVSGAMALYNDKRERVMVGQEMLRIFRRRNVGWGAERRAKLAKSEEERYVLVGRLMDVWVRVFDAEERPVREIAQQLTDLLNRCMLRGIENDFYLNIVDEVSRIYGGTMDAYQYMSIVEAIASTHKIASQTTETPGHVYCCRYTHSARGYSTTIRWSPASGLLRSLIPKKADRTAGVRYSSTKPGIPVCVRTR